MEHFAVDHRSDDAAVAVEVRFFNSILEHGAPGQPRETVVLAAGATLADLIGKLALPLRDIRLILRNSRPVAWSGSDRDAQATPLRSGDAIAFSGPAPFN